jgi:hypothetical protein
VFTARYGLGLQMKQSALRLLQVKSRRMRWVGYVARIGDRGGAYKDLVGGCEGRRPLRRPRPTWEDNIKMDFQRVGLGGMD